MDVDYSIVANYHWGTINENMTEEVTDGGIILVPGPFGFGTGVYVDGGKEQCQVHGGYNEDLDSCSVNPANCLNGFTFTIWSRIVISDQDLKNMNDTDPGDLSYGTVASSGGDKEGHPGIRIYKYSVWLHALVSTGDLYWHTMIPWLTYNDTWTNIGIRWSHPTVDEEGIELFLNGEPVASASTPISVAAAKEPLSPSEMMIGCHRTADDPLYTEYITAAFDEVATWTRRINDSETLYFLGGYSAEFAGDNPEEFAEKLTGADMNDPETAATMYNGLSDMFNTEVATSNTEEVDPTSATPGTEASPTDTAPSSTAMPITKNMKVFEKFVEAFNSATDDSKVPKNIDLQLTKKIFLFIEAASTLFGESNVDKMKTLQMKKDNPGSAKMMGDLTRWIRNIMHQVIYENSTQQIEINKITKNKIVVATKRNVSEWAASNDPYITSPNYKAIGHPVGWNYPIDRAAVCIKMIDADKCGRRAVNVVILSSRTYHLMAPTKVNEARMPPSRYYVIDSRTITVDVTCDPVLNEFGGIDPTVPSCKPTPEAMKRFPVKFKLRHIITSAFKIRSLKFHQEDMDRQIEQRYCAWWNTELGDFGVWDTNGCFMLYTTETYTKCACTQLGTFSVVARKTEPKEVPPENMWLTILRYIGYCVSFLFLIMYIIIVLLSSDLKDMFHVMGVNLSVAVLLGAVFMLVSDVHSIRDDRHTCTAIGTLIHYFYQSAGAWIFTLGIASFSAITSGVIGGRLRVYIPISWGMPLISVGLTYLLFLLDLGEDPRCFISWENPAKYVFFSFQLLFVFVSLICAIVVLTNMSTPALRKDNLIDDYGSFCRGAAMVMLFFDLTWIFGFFCYVRLGFTGPDFYPIFQVLNSWTGLIIFCSLVYLQGDLRWFSLARLR
ncbi:adhesion G protein-coupled receptor B1-like isoform X1 [Homarus americanus]|uniref:adhesion G protein-coupled receptor B1-like isoform X1 n=2 Tax=Homarus americanus TaxID=6706 RepID=UPI001C48F140|nr:adhesion G protein-coupled receptor B1-like isoform X1 [Homarus americanus]XP_042211665.1 adhesion G protein-coupled receptor B1-like isoform X1 [Homarus americanus]